MSDGIKFRSVSLQDEDYYLASIWFDLRRGLFEPAPVRGSDVVLPSAPSQVWMPKVPDSRIIELQGFVRGIGADLEERQTSWRESTQALMALLAFDDEPGALEVLPPYLGIDTSYSIQAVAINTMGGPVIGTMTYQRWNIQLKTYSDWTSGSS